MSNEKKWLDNLILMGIFSAICLVTSTGCIQQMAQLLYVIKGHEIKAQFEGLEGKRVAILCVSDSSAYGPDTLTYTVSKYVSLKLASGVKDVEVISPPVVEAWIDENGWDSQDYATLGDGVKADMVVVIEIGSYSIKEGATLYKGRADMSVTVYDVAKGGQVSFHHGPDNYVFPENGRPTTQSTERQFEMFYLARLTDRISRLFVPHNKMDAFAEDAMLMK
ncbi:MAG: hypothetical protein AB8B55_19045 [Mariniblastus sp.]